MEFKKLYLLVIVCANLVNVVITTKYGHISRCEKDYDGNGRYKIHFICETTNIEHNIFLDSSKETICLSSRFLSYQIIAISLENCKFPRFERNYFQFYSELHTFNTSDVGLEVLQTEIFDDATELINLYASQNQISEIPAQLFSKAVKLKIVDLSRNKIEKIDSLALDRLKSLEYLNLSCNQISEIHPTALNLPKLQTLDLSYNKINVLSDHSFDNASALKHLDLSCNPIGNLKLDTFAYLPDLEHLNLRRTNISSIILGSFSHQHRLVLLDLSENALKHLDFGLFFPILHDLKSLYLNENQLTDLSGFKNALFPSLTELDIKNNHFNCTYLIQFMDSIYWKQIHLLVDPKSTNLQKSNIRGINCEVIQNNIQENENENKKEEEKGNINGEGNETVTTHFQQIASLEKTLSDISEKSNDTNYNVFLMIVLLCSIFVILLGFCALFFLLNKNRLYSQCVSNKHNPRSDEFIENLMELK